MRNFYLVEFFFFFFFFGRSTYQIHQILGFPVPIFLTCFYTSFLNFLHFLAQKNSKISTRMDALPYAELTASAGQEKEDPGRSNTPPFTASPNVEKFALDLSDGAVHQRQLLLASSVFDIHYTTPTSYTNRVLPFSQGAHSLHCYGCFQSSGALMYSMMVTVLGVGTPLEK
jgi:hypothetical protein